MNFSQAVVSGLKNYSYFAGRASRSEYWYWSLFAGLGGTSTKVFDTVIFHVPYASHSIHPLHLIFLLGMLFPYFAVAVRRLHDVNHDGWWVLIGFTIIGGIFPLLIWNCRRGTEGDNRFGSDPLLTTKRSASPSGAFWVALFCVFLGMFGTVSNEGMHGSQERGILFLIALIAGWLMFAWDGYCAIKKA